MRIVSWNCHGKFREKFNFIQELDADIYVIQECENPEKFGKTFSGFCPEYVWYGEKGSKGLAIFAGKGNRIKENDWPFYCLRHFVSVRVNDAFDLLGVWAGPPYIEEYYVYQAINIARYNKDLIIIGDFNSNAIWDKKSSKRNHTAVVNELKSTGIVSVYHHITGESQGKETQATFYMYGNPEKPYHIDHCFASPDRIKSYRIMSPGIWLQHSDHMPVVLETT